MKLTERVRKIPTFPTFFWEKHVKMGFSLAMFYGKTAFIMVFTILDELVRETEEKNILPKKCMSIQRFFFVITTMPLFDWREAIPPEIWTYGSLS